MIELRKADIEKVKKFHQTHKSYFTDIDFLQLYNDGHLVSDFLYRIDEYLQDEKWLNNDYYISLIKYSCDNVDTYYKYCVIDKKTGNETFECSCTCRIPKIYGRVFLYNGLFYNAQTGNLIFENIFYHKKEDEYLISDNYIFIKDTWRDGKLKHGVYKLNIHTCQFELFY